MNTHTYQFTSESVSAGHPDKVADQISDAILDAYLAQDPQAKVACECLITDKLLVIAGEATSIAKIDPVEVAKKVLDQIGYKDEAVGFDWQTAEIYNQMQRQSPEINNSVKNGGAGDQGIMFGHACLDTPELMPLPIMLSHAIVRRLHQLRQDKVLPWLRPDAKSQVTVTYDEKGPLWVDNVIVSTQHSEEIEQEEIKEQITNMVLEPILQKWIKVKKPHILVNTSGSFTIGGPAGDTGLTGRKIIVDTYGGACPHGGGAFSGKDASKVDRSAAYAARYIAKHLVHSGVVSKCTVQLSYAIGVSQPTSVYVDSFGTNRCGMSILEEAILKLFPVEPNAIIDAFHLREPIFQETAAHGHFGNSSFPWEIIDEVKIKELLAMTGILKGPNSELPEYAFHREFSKTCFHNFRKDPLYGDLIFKWLGQRPFGVYLPFHVPDGLVIKTESDEFFKEEKERIPLFMGASIVGLVPGSGVFSQLKRGMLYGVLEKSILSGRVFGLKLKRYNKQLEEDEIIREWKG